MHKFRRRQLWAGGPLTRLGVLLSITVLAGTLGLGQSANAGPLTWNTCEGGSNSICDIVVPGPDLALPESVRTSSGSGVDKIFAFDSIEDSGKDLAARAFRTTSNLGTGYALKHGINIFEGGIGSGTETSPEHGVDNVGPDEFVVFKLPEDGFIPLSFRIGYKSTDADISTWIGGVEGGLSDALTLLLSGGFTWSAAGGALTSTHGYVQQNFLDVPVGVSQPFSLGASGRHLIIGARNEVDGCPPSACTDGGEDKFKILQIAGAQRVPEPATLLLLGTGLAAIALTGRRRRR